MGLFHGFWTLEYKLKNKASAMLWKPLGMCSPRKTRKRRFIHGQGPGAGFARSSRVRIAFHHMTRRL